MGQYTMNQNKQRYTCVSKPGEYELIGTSSGAGTMKGIPVMVYRDVTNGRLFHREPENFMARMKKIQPEQVDINAELLAALKLCSSAMEGIEGPGFKEAKLAIAKLQQEGRLFRVNTGGSHGPDIILADGTGADVAKGGTK
ncbi:hypothetical protein ST4_026 [Aeromonas phage ST4]|nr:hypothetical protein ST4_026 [Aeromonas phage ST4]